MFAVDLEKNISFKNQERGGRLLVFTLFNRLCDVFRLKMLVAEIKPGSLVGKSSC